MRNIFKGRYTPGELKSEIGDWLDGLTELGVEELSGVNLYSSLHAGGEPVQLLNRSGSRVDILEIQGRKMWGYAQHEWDTLGSASRLQHRKSPSMSFADDFVLARVNVDRAVAGVSAHRSIMDVARFDEMLTATYTKIDFGPFVGTCETPDTQLANRRWLRVVFLLAQFRSTGAAHMEALWWLDRPNESLDGISPFEATANDEAFARASALVFLTGGQEVEPDTIEAELFTEFCASLDVLPDALQRDRDSLLVKTFTALQQSSGSLATARLMLICAAVSGERSATLYRLVRECDAGTIDEILRTQFGYTGEGLDR